MNELETKAQSIINNWSFKEKVACIGHTLATMPQTELPLTHHFAGGLYIREIFMPADTYVIGQIHKTEHFNIIMKGHCQMMNEDGTKQDLIAPMMFVSKPGVQKVLYMVTDVVWLTTHVTDETDTDKIRESLIEPLLDDPIEKLLEELT